MAHQSEVHFSAPYRVRFDESTPEGEVRTSALLRYAQDCAWLHSESLGFGRDWYAGRGLAWLVRVATVSVVDHVGTGDRLVVTTAVTGFRRVWARRWTGIADPDGRAVAEIETDWVMTDLARGVPTRVPDDFPRVFGVPLDTFEPRRVRSVEPPPTASSVRLPVRRQDVDPMGHANNAAYLDWLEEAVAAAPDGGASILARPRRYVLEYLVPALPGDDLVGQAWRDPIDSIGLRDPPTRSGW